MTPEGGRRSKGSFSVREFLSGKQTFEGLLPQLDLTSATRPADTQINVHIRGYSQPDGERIDVESIPILTEQNDLLFSPISGPEKNPK